MIVIIMIMISGVHRIFFKGVFYNCMQPCKSRSKGGGGGSDTFLSRQFPPPKKKSCTG